MQELTEYERRAGQRAHHRALILQILSDGPKTHGQIVKEEVRRYGFFFTTDNRLRELRKQGYVVSRKGDDGLLHWSKV